VKPYFQPFPEVLAMRYLVPVGRLLYVFLFLMTPLGHFSQQGIGYAAQQGVPLPGLLVPLSGVIAFAGGLSVLLGYKAKVGAWLLVVFLVPVTVMMHNFWAVTDPMMAQMQQGMFMKNLAMLGTALLITHFGAGPVSLDERLAVAPASAGAHM
jgi:putative oxidoreductase